MIRKIVYLILPLLVIVFVSTVNAETTTTNSAQATVDAASKLKQQLLLIQEQKKEVMAKTKEEAMTMSQAKRDEFKVKLETIKDQRKKLLVERIDAKIVQVNKNQTDRFLEILTRLQGFLDKIKQSTTDPKVLTDAATAQTSIDTAKTAVEAQAVKAYIIQVTDDPTLKVNVGTVVSMLRQDLMTIYKLVIDAKQAVQKLNTDRTLIKKATDSAKINQFLK